MIAPLLRSVLLSIGMKFFDLIGDLRDQPIIQLAAGRNLLEQGPVSKAYHFEEPVDGGSLPVQVQLASAIPGNGANRKIERWRRPAVERQFCVQRGMAFVRTRKVEIVVMDGSLEFPGAIAGQEYVRRMRIYPARGFAGARTPGVSRKATASACCSVSPIGPADAVICGLCLTDLDLATACRHVLVLGQRHGQDAILELGGDPVLIDITRQ